MERFINQWYYGIRDENQALPPRPSLPLPLQFQVCLQDWVTVSNENQCMNAPNGC